MKSHDPVYYLKFKPINDIDEENRIGMEITRLLGDIIHGNDITFNESVDGSESMYLFIEEHLIADVKNLSLKENILLEYEEISIDILMGVRNNNNDFIETFLKSDEFTHILENYITKNLTCDIVLDKINRFGIKSLNSVDY